ncbi:hypothetical protein SAMN04487944_101482 [Gracilibacillus ureilyticus]|uniref:Uncharacterized protein n=1 Tax=Gracilibacillus ureilyticus TaxID=531814 RepID=A0A1H9LZU0_9BACI|nr:hypothetical protein [Gracilibacillus ureilyticus]SER16942.1 hypothetical protein SAMN04487944_101482 [Gracilibacillus ureilyticus]
MRVLYTATAFFTIIALTLMINSNKSTEIMKYFPIDEEIQFSEASTSLSLLQQLSNDRYQIRWISSSKTTVPVYLRQDISLLYMDGKLKGIKGLWKENEQDIYLQADFEETDSSHFQTISFHHGEVHYPNDVIKSVQTMSHNNLYVIDSPYSPLEAFHTAESQLEKNWQETLNHATSQQLNFRWKEWIDRLKIDSQKYDLVPLTSLYVYNKKPIQGLSQEETDRVVGQLWEGLYREYILPISDTNRISQQIIPIILIDKNREHLYVLFNDQRDELKLLKQNIKAADQT